MDLQVWSFQLVGTAHVVCAYRDPIKARHTLCTIVLKKPYLGQKRVHESNWGSLRDLPAKHSSLAESAPTVLRLKFLSR